MMLERNKFYLGDSYLTLKTFPDNSIDCSVSSPPYWGLRSYGVDGQLGVEKNPMTYIKKLLEIYSEVYRVIKPTGSVWVNLGDKFSGSNGTGYKQKLNKSYIVNPYTGIENELNFRKAFSLNDKDYKAKSLMLLPYIFALGMLEIGYVLRDIIIWHKINCKPESVKNRFTVDYEPFFFFTKKSTGYYFEQQFEQFSEAYIKDKRPKGVLRQRLCPNTKYKDMGSQYNLLENNAEIALYNREKLRKNNLGGIYGRNKRSVWSITSANFKGAHFAVFPIRLISIPIHASCPKKVCSDCGKPYIPIYEPTEEYAKHLGKSWTPEQDKSPSERSKVGFTKTSGKKVALTSQFEFHGYQKTCKCIFDDTDPGVVLDPFMGSGSVAVAATKLERDYIGIDISQKYIDMSLNRVFDECICEAPPKYKKLRNT